MKFENLFQIAIKTHITRIVECRDESLACAAAVQIIIFINIRHFVNNNNNNTVGWLPIKISAHNK